MARQITVGEVRDLVDLFIGYCEGPTDPPAAVLATKEYRGFVRLYHIKGRRCTVLNQVAMAFLQRHSLLVDELFL